MAFIKNPAHFNRDELQTMISGIKIVDWKPKFPTLHNTGDPSLARWKRYGATPQERWGANLNNYFQGMGWHAGPHFVCCPDYIWYLSDLAEDGVSVSCWNHSTVGIEMVGDYEVGSDDFTTGDGARVRDNAVFLLAVLCRKFGWRIDDYVQGASGLHFHKECPQDHHACPGSKVSKSSIIQLVKAQLAQFSAPVATGTPAATAVAGPEIMSVEDIQGALNRLGANPQLDVNGEYDGATKAAVTAFQKAHDCDVDGWVGPQTAAALKTALAARAKASPDLNSVEDLQGALNKLGAKPQLTVNGEYDEMTKAAVVAFQQSHNCDVDGWVGPQTTAAIKAALAA